MGKITTNPLDPAVEAQVDEILTNLTVNTGEEYHKLHSGQQGFKLTDGRMRFYETKAKTAITRLLLRERVAERENMKFINPQTGVEIHGPYLQYRFTGDGLLLNWEDRTKQLEAQIKELE